VNFTRRGKWLTAGAALIAAWVVFGPRDPEAVEAAGSAATPAVHTAHAARGSAQSAPAARSFSSLAHRVAGQTSVGSLFAVHSWYVPPPPPPPVVDNTPVAPPKPTAPPLPYQFIGSYTPDGQPTVFFLSSGDRVYDVHVGDTLENTYSIDSFSNGQLTLTFKPLNIQQQLTAGTKQ